VAAFVPAQGDFIAVSFDPQAGHEQAGRRPALVLSNDAFNARTGLCIVCPVTNSRRDHPFHVSVPEGTGVSGVVMVEQVTSMDFRARDARPIGPADAAVLGRTLSLLDAFVS
jgi:mRNA interferase MazF